MNQNAFRVDRVTIKSLRWPACIIGHRSSMQKRPNTTTHEPSKLQTALPLEKLNRDYSAIQRLISSGLRSVDDCSTVPEFIQRRVYENTSRRFGETPEITILDAGCGTGAAIEEVMRIMEVIMREEFRVRVKIQGIGIDLSPLPQLIGEDILKIDPKLGVKKQHKKYPLQADIHADDVVTMATITSESIDLIYSANCLQYVEDVLGALESGWRVLKPGGIMVWHTTASTNSEPDFEEILRQTPEAEKNIWTVEGFSSSDYSTARDIIVGHKKKDSKFKKFPFILRPKKSSQDENNRSEDLNDYYSFVKKGKYEKIEN